MEVQRETIERWGPLLAGGALLAWAARRRSPLRAALALAAPALLYRGATGRWPALGPLAALGERAPDEAPTPGEPRPVGRGETERSRAPVLGKRDRVEKQSEESFPASDAPSFTPGKLG